MQFAEAKSKERLEVPIQSFFPGTVVFGHRESAERPQTLRGVLSGRCAGAWWPLRGCLVAAARVFAAARVLGA